MEGDRIEIELVPNDGGGRRAPSTMLERQERPVADAERTLEAESPDSGSDRRTEPARTIVIAAAVGLVALVLGWAAGRSGGVDDAASTTAATVEVTAPPTPATDVAEVPADTIAPLDEPAPLVSWPPVARQRNANDLVESGATIERELVEIDPRLAGWSLSLVAQRGGDLSELDLADGVLTSYVLDGLPRNYGTALAVGDDWVVIPMYDDVDSIVVFDDGRVERADLIRGGNQLLHVPNSDRFWRTPVTFTGGGVEITEVTVSGEPTGAVIELPTNVWPAFGDPRGGVVVQSSGRWFAVGPGGSDTIGVGELIALDTATAVLFDCVELDDCALWRVDRASAVATRVPLAVDLRNERFVTSAWWSGNIGAGLSPGGRRLVASLEDGNGRSELVAVDLITGDLIELAPSRPGSPTATWSDDGAYVVYLDGVGIPTAYSFERHESFPVVADGDVRGWNSLSARP